MLVGRGCPRGAAGKTHLLDMQMGAAQMATAPQYGQVRSGSAGCVQQGPGERSWACRCGGDSARGHSGAGLQWTAQTWYSAFSQSWITPWFLLRNKDLSVLTGGQLTPCALLLWSLMVVDRQVLLTSHLVVPHQLHEKDLPALSPCPTLREVIGVGVQRSTLYMGALESCSLKRCELLAFLGVPYSWPGAPWGCGFVHHI